MIWIKSCILRFLRWTESFPTSWRWSLNLSDILNSHCHFRPKCLLKTLLHSFLPKLLSSNRGPAKKNVTHTTCHQENEACNFFQVLSPLRFELFQTKSNMYLSTKVGLFSVVKFVVNLYNEFSTSVTSKKITVFENSNFARAPPQIMKRIIRTGQLIDSFLMNVQGWRRKTKFYKMVLKTHL